MYFYVIIVLGQCKVKRLMDGVFPEGKLYFQHKYPEMILNFRWEMRNMESSHGGRKTFYSKGFKDS